LAQNRAQKHSQTGGSTKTNESAARSSSRPPSKPPLVGFVVAKKVSKSACKRNRAKRRIREAYKLLRRSSLAQSSEVSQLFLEQWYAIVFVIHEKVMTATWEEIEKSVASCLIKANTKYGRGKLS
jgi:ribonuclease P protein component